MTKLSVDPTLSKANSLIKRGRFADARELYENILNNFPNNMRVIKALESLNELQTKTSNYYPPKQLVRELVNHYNNGNLPFVYK